MKGRCSFFFFFQNPTSSAGGVRDSLWEAGDGAATEGPGVGTADIDSRSAMASCWRSVICGAILSFSLRLVFFKNQKPHTEARARGLGVFSSLLRDVRSASDDRRVRRKTTKDDDDFSLSLSRSTTIDAVCSVRYVVVNRRRETQVLLHR